MIWVWGIIIFTPLAPTSFEWDWNPPLASKLNLNSFSGFICAIYVATAQG